MEVEDVVSAVTMGLIPARYSTALARYYFVVDLLKKTVVAVLTGGVPIDPYLQITLLFAATASQALFVLLVAPMKDHLFQYIEIFSCLVDAGTFACALSILYRPADAEAIGWIMLAMCALGFLRGGGAFPF